MEDKTGKIKLTDNKKICLTNNPLKSREGKKKVFFVVVEIEITANISKIKIGHFPLDKIYINYSE